MFENDDQRRIFGVTWVENLFFSEYLPEADGDFVKVYLCALYHCQLRDDSFGVHELSNTLALDLNRVEAALRYWERRRLISRVSNDPPKYHFHHLGQRLLTGQNTFEADRPYLAFSESVYALFGDKRKIRPADIATAYEWVEELSTPQDLVLLLLSHCMTTLGVGFSFKRAEKILLELKSEGIQTAEDAESFFNHDLLTRKGTKAVLRRFGQNRNPTLDELAHYAKWTNDWGFSAQDVLDACAETIKASSPSFGYLNTILDRIQKSRQSKADVPLKKQLSEQNALNTRAQEVLSILGVRLGPTAIAPALSSLESRYSHELILLAANSIRLRNGRFEDIEPLLISWAQRGLTDASSIRALLSQQAQQLSLFRSVQEACGQEGLITPSDRNYLEKWQKDFSDELIVLAASRARDAKTKMPYIDKVLGGWKDQGVKEVGQALSQQGPQPDKLRPSKEVSAHRYEQRTYTEKELEGNVNDLLKEALESRET